MTLFGDDEREAEIECALRSTEYFLFNYIDVTRGFSPNVGEDKTALEAENVPLQDQNLWASCHSDALRRATSSITGEEKEEDNFYL
jgi:hypothetical protein